VTPLFRPWVRRLVPAAWVVASFLFLVHAAIRFGGLGSPLFIPLSLAILLPLPWLLSPRPARREMGFRAPERAAWFAFGPLAALGALGVCAALAWAAFGAGDANWFMQHALALRGSLDRLPPGASVSARFWMVTIPAMIFSPFAEEFLFRGYLMRSFSERWSPTAGMLLQATAFALVHLAHYGLVPFQPALIAVWVPSMFGVALVLGWIVRRSGSVWPAVVAHVVFNLGMNAAVFALLPGAAGVA
jgi:membrane protease YdiL (CAAX protease family)